MSSVLRIFSFFRTYPLILIFSLLCLMFYEHVMRLRNNDMTMLMEQRKSLTQQKEEALSRRDRLLRDINSQSDPAWVELTLIKGLGLVPEGHTKIVFREEG